MLAYPSRSREQTYCLAVAFVINSAVLGDNIVKDKIVIDALIFVMRVMRTCTRPLLLYLPCSMHTCAHNAAATNCTVVREQLASLSTCTVQYWELSAVVCATTVSFHSTVMLWQSAN